MGTREPGFGDDRAAHMERRRSRLGGSEIATVLGLNPWSTPWDVWADKTGRLETVELDNAATRLGQRLEPAILDEAENDLGPLERDICYVEGLVGSTLDGRVISKNEVVEAKTAGLLNRFDKLEEWGDEGTDQVPQMYLVQVQAQMYCSDAQLAHVYAMLAGRGIVAYRVERSAKVCAYIKDFVERWWEEHVVADVAPTGSEVSLETIKRLKREPAKTIELSDHAEQLWCQRVLEKSNEKSAKENLKKIDAQLLFALGDAEAGVLPSGQKITYLEQSRKGYSVEPCSYRVLRMKKSK